MAVDRSLEAPALELEAVTFSYPGMPVFHEVSLAVPSGGLTQIVGPNGGGKTTLAKLCLGLLKPVSGTVRVLGTEAIAARRRVGYVPQHAHYDPQFPASVLDVVMTGRLVRAFGPFTRADRTAAYETIDLLGLSSQAKRGFAELSGGQRQRVLLARALVSRPSLLILDEPTANIDRESARRLESFILRQKDLLSILLITHDFDFLSDAVDRVLCVHRNAHLHDRHSLSEGDLQRLFLGHFHALAETDLA